MIADLEAAALDVTRGTLRLAATRSPDGSWVGYAKDGGAFAARVARDARDLDRPRRRRLVAEARKIVAACARDLVAEGVAEADAECYAEAFSRAIEPCLAANRDRVRCVIAWDGVPIVDYDPSMVLVDEGRPPL